MRELPDNSIPLVITSPPYDDLRNYEGYSFNFEEIAKELFRVVAQGGVIVWVVKDAVKEGNRTLTSFKQAIYFQHIGFKVYDVIIFSKNGTSAPHKNRYADTFEYMFIISKGLPKTVNLLRDRPNKCAGQETWGSRSLREKDGSSTRKGKYLIPEKSIRFNIWLYDVGFAKGAKDKIAFEHPATFPEQLAEDHVLSWSNEGDLVMDPFMGSGTTGKMALKNGRQFIGIEIAQKYYAIAEKRLEGWRSQTKLGDSSLPPPPKGRGIREAI